MPDGLADDVADGRSTDAGWDPPGDGAAAAPVAPSTMLALRAALGGT